MLWMDSKSTYHTTSPTTPPDIAHWLPSMDRSSNFPSTALSDVWPISILDCHVGLFNAKLSRIDWTYIVLDVFIITLGVILATSSLLDCLWFIVPLDKFFSLIWRRHHYRQRAANFDLCSALMAIQEWEFSRGGEGSYRQCLLPYPYYVMYIIKVCLELKKKVFERDTYRDEGYRFIIVISEDHCHSHLLPSVSKWSCHYLYLTIKICRGWNSNTQPSACGAIALAHRRLLVKLSLIHIWRCRRYAVCRSRWSPYH